MSEPDHTSRRPRRPTAALIVASLALLVAAAPPAYAALAANSVGSSQIKNNSVATVDLKAGAVTSGRIKDQSISVDDLGSSARWRRTMVGSWDHDPGIVENLSIFPAVTTLGSLSSGTGQLKLARASKVLVNGSLLAQNQSGGTRNIFCNAVIGGSTVSPRSTALLLNGSSTTLAISAAKDLDPGTYDVSLTCSTELSGMTAGNVHVNVVAVPLH